LKQPTTGGTSTECSIMMINTFAELRPMLLVASTISFWEWEASSTANFVCL